MANLRNKSGAISGTLPLLLLILGSPAYLYFNGVPRWVYPLLGRPAGNIQIAGMVERRLAYFPFFDPLKSGDPVYPGDVVHTGPNGKAVLVFPEGTMIDVGPVTLFRLVSASPAEIRAVLYRGELNRRTGQMRTAELVTSTERGLFAPLLDTVKYLQVSKETVAVARGSLPLVSGAERSAQRPSSRATASVPRASARPRKPQSLELVSPQPDRLTARMLERIPLRWTKVLPNITYVVEVSPDEDFDNKIKEHTKKTSTSLRLNRTGNFYIRVRTLVRGKWVSSRTKQIVVRQ